VRRRLLPLLLLGALAGTAALALRLLPEGGGRAGRAEREEPREAPPLPPPAPRREEAGEGGGGTPASWRLSGSVRDAGGRPVAGARVAWGNARAAAAEDGAFLLEAAAVPDRVEVVAEGFLPVLEPFLPQGEPPWRRDFTLLPAAVFSGRVTGEGSLPVKGATVYLVGAGHAYLDVVTPANTARTDADGRYSFPGVPAGTTDLGVRARGYLPQLERDVAVPAQGRLVRDVALRRGRTVFVRVLDEPRDATVLGWDARLRDRLLTVDGLPGLADALVGRSFEATPVVRGVREGGRFVLSGLSPAPLDVRAAAPGHLAEPGRGLLFGTLEEELTLTLARAVGIRVEARDAATGQALQPSVVRRSEGLEEPVEVERSLDGTLPVPADGRRHALVFSADGYEPATLELPDLRGAAPAPLFRVLLTPIPQEAAGRFHLAPEPAYQGRMSVVGVDGKGEIAFVLHLEEPDARGRWTVAPVPPGTFEVTVLATGKVPFTLPRVVVTETLQESHPVRFSEGGGLALTVRDREGNLLDQVYLMLVDGDGRRIHVQVVQIVSEGGRGFASVNFIPTAASVRSDSGLAPGAYTLTAAREGYERASKTFQVVGTETAEVALALTRR